MTPTAHLRLFQRNDDKPPVLQQMWTETISLEEGWRNEWRDVPLVLEGSAEDRREGGVRPRVPA